MLPSQISYKDLQVRLQTLGCCLGDKTAIYNEALELGKDCSDKLEKLAYAISLYKVIRDYNTDLVLIPAIEGVQEEVAYENQEDGNCITIEQADIIFQYLQDYCKDCFREYGYYDTGILPSNDSGGWVGSSGIYVVSRQIQANWTQTNTDAVDYIKNKSIAGFIVEGSNITITGSGTISDPYIISSSGGGGGGSMVYPGAGIPVSTGSAWGASITNNSSNWNTAYSWGNHASAGYLTASSSNTLTNKSGNISMWTNDSGYITSAALSGYATQSWVTTQLSDYMLKSTYDTDNDGVVDSAQSMMTIGRNSTGSTLYKGTIVYISGSTGNRPNFVKAKADVESTSAGTFGVIYADIANNADGYVVTIGTISTLDTRTTAANPFTSDTLADGDTIYLSPDTAGYVTNIKPTAPNHLVYLGKVVRTSPTQGTIVYRVQNGYELDELHDVQAASPNSNDTLYYDAVTRLWKTASIASILGYTPVTNVRTLTINGTAYDLSADRSWTVTGLPSGTQGDILYHNGSNWVVLGAGTSGQFLKTNGAAANPTWANQGSVYQNLSIATNATSYTPQINGYRETLITCYGLSSTTLTINAPTTTGTLVEGDKLIFRFSDNGTLRNLSWDPATSVFVQRGAALPTTTITINKISTITFLYNATAVKWDCVGYVIEY